MRDLTMFLNRETNQSNISVRRILPIVPYMGLTTLLDPDARPQKPFVSA
jgi:hypothetical protein